MSVLSLALVTKSLRWKLFNFAMRIVHDTGAAEEIVQDGISKAMEFVERDKPVNFVSWLFSIVRNSAFHWRRDKAKHEAAIERGPLQRFYPPAETEVISRESLREFFFACKFLTERQRQVLYFRAFDGLSHAEIGQKLGMGEGAVRAIFHRARQHLEGWRQAVQAQKSH